MTRLRWFLLGSITTAVVGYVMKRRPPNVPDIDADAPLLHGPRCGVTTWAVGGPARACIRPRGHLGWHADDERGSWSTLTPIDLGWLDRTP